MAVTIVGNNTPTAGGVVYGDGTNYASTSAGSSGGVLYSTGSGAPAFSSAGSAGQFLQSNGSSAPSWATPAGGAWNFITSVTASNSATVDVENAMTAYDNYVIVASLVLPSTDATDLLVKLKIGGSYDNNANYNSISMAAGTGGSTWTGYSVSPGSSIKVAVSRSNVRPGGLVMWIYKPSNSTYSKTIEWSCNLPSNGNYVSTIVGGGQNVQTDPLTGIRFYFSSGNVSTGTFRLYGIANS